MQLLVVAVRVSVDGPTLQMSHHPCLCAPGPISGSILEYRAFAGRLTTPDTSIHLFSEALGSKPEPRALLGSNPSAASGSE